MNVSYVVFDIILGYHCDYIHVDTIVYYCMFHSSIATCILLLTTYVSEGLLLTLILGYL